MPHRLGARWRLDRALDLEELHEFDAPELVNLAHVDAVRSCRVAELVRVNGDAKQIRLFATKTRCLIGR